MVIKMDYIGIIKMINEMLRIAKEVKRETEHMEEVTEDLYVFWESEAKMEYAMRLCADFYSIKAMLEEMKQSIRLLAGVVRKFDENEKSIRGIIAAM